LGKLWGETVGGPGTGFQTEELRDKLEEGVRTLGKTGKSSHAASPKRERSSKKGGECREAFRSPVGTLQNETRGVGGFLGLEWWGGTWGRRKLRKQGINCHKRITADESTRNDMQ